MHHIKIIILAQILSGYMNASTQLGQIYNKMRDLNILSHRNEVRVESISLIVDH